MVVSWNINEDAYNMMLKTKRMLNANSKRGSATCPKILPFLKKKNEAKETETQFSFSIVRPPGPPRTRPLLRSGFLNEHSLFPSNNVSYIHSQS